MVILTGDHLTLENVRKVIYENEKVEVSKNSWERVEKSRNTVETIVRNGQIVYGINTGFGKLSDVKIKDKDVKALQKNLIFSHASGVGEPFSPDISKTICLLRANTLLKGYSGVRPIIIDRLLQFINRGMIPVIPQQGSLGASGDLAPLSHLALTIIGEGEVYYHGKRMATIDAYKKEGLEPIQLEAKEGLALINGTQVMSAIGAIAYLEAEKLAYQSEIIAALTMEALEGIIDAFDESIHYVRGYEEQMDVAKRMRQYLSDSQLISRQGEKRLQDAYSLRCIPQVHGASWQTLRYVKEKLEIEMNAATDNPLIFPEENKVVSGGNFHGQPIAFAMDFLKLGMSELGNISERRTERLVNPQLNDFPPFLSTNPGLESGLMILQYSAASLVSENKTLAHPASVDSIPSSGNQEDHVSMGTTAARHVYQIIQNARICLAIECICALQALEHRDVEKMASITKHFYEQARKIVPKVNRDRIFSKDIERMNEWLKQSSLFFVNKDG